MSWCCTPVAGVVGDDETDPDAETSNAATLKMVGDDGKDAATMTGDPVGGPKILVGPKISLSLLSVLLFTLLFWT